MRKLTYRATKRATARNRARHAKNALRVTLKTGRVVVEGVNIVKRHRKARTAEEQSGIIDFPAAIHHSNVMLLDPKGGTPTRVHARIDDDGTKERVSAKSGDAIPRVVSRKR